MEKGKWKLEIVLLWRKQNPSPAQPSPAQPNPAQANAVQCSAAPRRAVTDRRNERKAQSQSQSRSAASARGRVERQGKAERRDEARRGSSRRGPKANTHGRQHSQSQPAGRSACQLESRSRSRSRSRSSAHPSGPTARRALSISHSPFHIYLSPPSSFQNYPLVQTTETPPLYMVSI